MCSMSGVKGSVLESIYMLWTKKNLNRTLVIASPFQTYVVGLLVEFVD